MKSIKIGKCESCLDNRRVVVNILYGEVYSGNYRKSIYLCITCLGRATDRLALRIKNAHDQILNMQLEDEDDD